MFKRILWIVLDSVGAGASPDAEHYGDTGANTLLHVYKKEQSDLDNMAKMGLFNILGIDYKRDLPVIGVYGKAKQSSAGKDTTTGHWEMTGLHIEKPFPTFPDGFPEELIRQFNQITATDCLGNCVASGTEIIQKFGDEHIRTGYPIVYTSADSVFQIACHEEIYPIEKLYHICREARKILTGKYGVGRVIARPFVGENGNYFRTKNRQDFSLDPIEDTILDKVKEIGLETYGIGKIEDIFNHRGLTASDHAHGNTECLKATYTTLDRVKEGIIFVNLVDFDMIYGHRRDSLGYSKALEEFDTELGKFMHLVKSDDLILITADHGCDPTFKGTDHTREYVPILAWNKQMKRDIHIGIRATLRDMAATVAENYGINQHFGAESFLTQIKESM